MEQVAKMNDPIIYHVQDGTGILRVNRPAARNALNWVAQEQFAQVVQQAVEDRLRVLIVTDTGDRAFVSGGDLKELARHPEKEAGERLNCVMSRALAQMTELPFPVIAAINGDAFGGGCEIITACDLRLAAAQARFGFAQVRQALTTGWGGAGRLVQQIGQSRALELLLTGRVLSAKEAQRIGLIHHIVPEGENVLDAALVRAKALQQLPAQALAAIKTLVQAAGWAPLPEIAQMETQLFTNLWSKPDHQEALQAFLEKREPVFNQDWPSSKEGQS